MRHKDSHPKLSLSVSHGEDDDSWMRKALILTHEIKSFIDMVAMHRTIHDKRRDNNVFHDL